MSARRSVSALPSKGALPSVSATTAVVILAAGKGVRMKSARPKVLHSVGGRPMLDRVLELAVRHAGEAAPRLVVVGAQREEVVRHLAESDPTAIPVVQEPQRGTGDAVRCALAALGDTTAKRILVLSGDVPLLAPATLLALEAAFGRHSEGAAAPKDAALTCAVAFLTALADEPGSYGRVVRNPHGAVTRIVEAKDASADELLVKETNAGVYLFDRVFLTEALPRLGTSNAQGEWYLTDVIGLAVAARRGVEGVVVRDATEILGANSRADLARLESALQTRLAAAAMAGGVTLLRPETVTLEDGVTFEPDAVLEPFVSLSGATHVGAGARIGQGSILRDTKVGPGVTVKAYTVAEGATIGAGSVVGPFARLREGTELEEGVHVGNFVETKKARLKKGAKANHLTYLGDVSVGERTNVGAGVITCNYDGFQKHRTEIGADVFVGSDTQLVAPVSVGDGAVIGAGSTVTRDVPANAVTTSRVAQRDREGAAVLYREKRTAAKVKKDRT